MGATRAGASPQVVGDEAGEKYAVDIESFAACEDGKVVRPEADAKVPAHNSDVGAARVKVGIGAGNEDARHERRSGLDRPNATSKRKGETKLLGGRNTDYRSPAP